MPIQTPLDKRDYQTGGQSSFLIIKKKPIKHEEIAIDHFNYY